MQHHSHELHPIDPSDQPTLHPRAYLIDLIDTLITETPDTLQKNDFVRRGTMNLKGIKNYLLYAEKLDLQKTFQNDPSRFAFPEYFYSVDIFDDSGEIIESLSFSNGSEDVLIVIDFSSGIRDQRDVTTDVKIHDYLISFFNRYQINYSLQ